MRYTFIRTKTSHVQRKKKEGVGEGGGAVPTRLDLQYDQEMT